MSASLKREISEDLVNRIRAKLRFPKNNSLKASNLFVLYAKIFRTLLSQWERSDLDENREDDQYSQELDNLVLPSNEEWRLQVYYHLVQLQRANDCRSDQQDDIITDETPQQMEQSVRKLDRRTLEILNIKKWDWEPNPQIVYPLTPRSSRREDSLDSNASTIVENSVDPGWRLQDVLLAAKLLTKFTSFEQRQNYTNEAEMRRVFGLVYDVLRYGKIMNIALDNVGFWHRYPHLRKREKLVWLLLYDMHGRKFTRAGSNSVVMIRNAALKEAGLLELENALLDMKTKVAAGFSRLRIRGSALSLDELLPAHLRTAEGVIWGEEGSIASGWVNSAKIRSRRQFIAEMQKLGLTLCMDCLPTFELEEHQYVFDPLCPKVVNIHEKARERLAVSHLVRSHGFIFMERSLCLGAATLMQAFRVGRLSGPVILTHSLAPRHTGYLAELLVDVEDAGKLFVFGLGDNHTHHQLYLQELGIPMQRFKLFSERYTSSPTLPEIDRATVILATPPCSCTGVRDVVDLAIARGGDLELLESLTSQQAESPQQPRSLLAEQMSTLKYALTRPNIQLVIYEVHTLLPCETVDMTRQVVQQINKMTHDKFQRDRVQRKRSPARESIGRKSKFSKRSKSVESIMKSQDDLKSSIEKEIEVYSAQNPESHIVPKISESDLFEVSGINEIFQRDCTKLIDQGTYIALIKRKEIMQFNSQFMIKVAEAKGIFGNSTKESEPMKIYKQPTPTEISTTSRRRRKSNKIQFERITAPTHASILRALPDKHLCPRHQQHLVNEESCLEKYVQEAKRRDAHRWWDEVAHAWRRNSSNAEDYGYRALKTDPLTRKILFPSHVVHITYPEKSPPSLEVS